MTILDKLMEKKDLIVYIDLRKKILLKILKEIKKFPEADRNTIKIKNEVKIQELEKIKNLILNNELKEECKFYYRKNK
jgi:hypothetical protein